MLGVSFNAARNGFRLDEDCPLTFYDSDFNDPPLDLRPDVETWLRENTPLAEIEYSEFLGIWIIFEDERDVILFKTFWL